MVIYDQLRISDDGKLMYINVHVNTASCFDNVYLDRIVIKTANQVSEIAPELSEGDNVYEHSFGEEDKEGALVLSSADFIGKVPLSGTLFFVYVICKGTPCMDAPCRLDEMTTLAVTFDDTLLYQRVMGFTKDMVDDCGKPSQAFVDFILLWNAFKASVETEHWVSAIRFYNMLFSGNKISANKNTKGCGCHGRVSV